MKHTCCRGFTLVELLVVIAIIAILLSVLFPVASTALARSRATSCRHHIRQAGASLLADSATEKRMAVYDFTAGRVSGGWIILGCGCRIPKPDVIVPASVAVLDGCPDGPVNPVYRFDPLNQPKRLSFGILAYNQGVATSAAWPWLLACSESVTIRSVADVEPRHAGRANVFHMDGHVAAMKPTEIEFPAEVP